MICLTKEIKKPNKKRNSIKNEIRIILNVCVISISVLKNEALYFKIFFKIFSLSSLSLLRPKIHIVFKNFYVILLNFS